MATTIALGGCTDGGEDARPAPTSSTTVEPTRCADGSVVPDAAPAPAPPALDAPAEAAPARDGALDVGTLLPRTGDLAFLGRASLAGVELAVADLDEAGGVLGAPVGLRHGDSAEGSPGTADAEVAALLAGGVDVIIGPLASATTARLLEPVAGAGAIVVSPAGGSGGLDALDRDGRLFRTGVPEALQGRALAELVLADGHRTASIAARSDEYGRSIADAFAARLEAGGGTVTSRTDYDPSADGLGDDVVTGLDTAADAIVLVGLAETAPLLDALVAVGEAPSERAVYGTDGNLGDRLGDLVSDRRILACMRGVLPVSEPDDAFAARLRAHDPTLAEVGPAGLDWAAESYDATVLAALAAAAAGTDDGAALGAALPTVGSGGAPCTTPQDCLASIAAGVDVTYVGRSGAIGMDEEGNRSAAGVTMVAFDGDGHLARLGGRQVRN